MNDLFEMSPGFWDDFVRDYWLQKPGVFRRPSPSALVNPQQFFDACAMYTARSRLSSQAPTNRVRVYVDGALQSQPVDQGAVLASDGSLDGYLERMKRQHGDKEFGLVLSNVQVLSDTIWWRSAGFLRALYEHVGHAPGCKIDGFFGTYRGTPFGIHKDDEEVFTFVVQGTKRFLLWPYEFLSDRFDLSGDHHWGSVNPGLVVDDDLRRSAIVLDGEPGDVMYCPSSYWHVAEWTGEGPPPATLGLGIRQHAFSAHANPFAMISQVMGDMCFTGQTPMAPLTLPFYLGPGASGIDRALDALMVRARDHLTHAQVQRGLEERALAWLTALGYQDIPDLLAAPALSETDDIESFAAFPIVYRRYASDDVVCSIHGRLLAASDRFLPLVHRLNQGGRHSVGVLISEFTSAGIAQEERLSREELLEALQALYCARAIRVAGPDRVPH
jgi:50S ribosomal protein L16 3-hydroxylase